MVVPLVSRQQQFCKGRRSQGKKQGSLKAAELLRVKGRHSRSLRGKPTVTKLPTPGSLSSLRALNSHNSMEPLGRGAQRADLAHSSASQGRGKGGMREPWLPLPARLASDQQHSPVTAAEGRRQTRKDWMNDRQCSGALVSALCCSPFIRARPSPAPPRSAGGRRSLSFSFSYIPLQLDRASFPTLTKSRDFQPSELTRFGLRDPATCTCFPFHSPSAAPV